MFTQQFDKYVCEGDTIECEVDGFTCRATIYRDDTSDAPDERDCGFWPSLDPNDAGFIGPKSKSTLARHMAKAKSVMEAWRNDEWFYCGVAVTVWKSDICLTHEYGSALWGVECNYPSRNQNAYLQTVANDLIDEALAEARAAIAKLCAA